MTAETERGTEKEMEKKKGTEDLSVTAKGSFAETTQHPPCLSDVALDDAGCMGWRNTPGFQYGFQYGTKDDICLS